MVVDFNFMLITKNTVKTAYRVLSDKMWSSSSDAILKNDAVHAVLIPVEMALPGKCYIITTSGKIRLCKLDGIEKDGLYVSYFHPALGGEWLMKSQIKSIEVVFNINRQIISHKRLSDIVAQ